ncbi:fimbrial protein [Pseudoxanthomonas sp.]|uniref:fimbrial protein n=1 Tax=Pseudoxanthomonas sp. TaxID=1871049 RepID=UPI003F7DBFF9
MSKSLKGLLVLALAGAAANSAMAADGQISFTGKVIASACKVDDGKGGKEKPDIKVDMGTVTSESITNEPTSVSFNAVKNISMTLECGEVGTAKKLHMYFRPNEGTGLDANGTLKVTGGATNVAIALLDGNNQKIDLSNAGYAAISDLTEIAGSTPTMHTTNLSLGAAYVKTGATITEGRADATLPFVLEYH